MTTNDHLSHREMAAIYEEQVRAIRDQVVPTPKEPDEDECCASGRCEVCTPGYDWGVGSMNDRNEKTVITIDRCQNWECPNRANEGRFTLVRYTNPVGVVGGHRNITLVLCGPCAESMPTYD